MDSQLSPGELVLVNRIGELVEVLKKGEAEVNQYYPNFTTAVEIRTLANLLDASQRSANVVRKHERMEEYLSDSLGFVLEWSDKPLITPEMLKFDFDLFRND